MFHILYDIIIITNVYFDKCVMINFIKTTLNGQKYFNTIKLTYYNCEIILSKWSVGIQERNWDV